MRCAGKQAEWTGDVWARSTLLVKSAVLSILMDAASPDWIAQIL